MSAAGRTMILLGTSNVLNKMLWAGVVFLFIRSAGPEGYGLLSAFWAIGALLAPLSDFGGSQLLLREGARNRALVQPMFLRFLKIKIVASAVFVVLGILAAVTIFRAESGLGSGSLVILSALGVGTPLLDHLHTMATPVLQIANRLQIFAIYRVAYFSGLLLAVGGALLAGMDIFAVSMIYLAFTLLWVIAFFRAVWGYIPGEVQEPPGIVQMIRDGSHFLGVSLLNLAYYRVDLLLVSALLGATYAGIYGGQYQVILVFFMFPSVCFNVLFSDLYRKGGRQRALQPYFDAFMKYMNIIAVGLFTGLVFSAREIMSFLGGSAYMDEVLSFRILSVLVLLFFCSVALNFMNAVDRVGRRLRYETYAIMLTLVGGSLIVPLVGIEGMAMTSVLAYFGAGVFALRELFVEQGFEWHTCARQALLVVISSLAASTALLVPAPLGMNLVLYGAAYLALLFLAGVLSRKEVAAILQLRSPLLAE